MPDTLADRLRALEELRADVQTKLEDALELAAGGGKGARLSREDVAAYRRQLAVLDEAEAWIRAIRPQTIPAAERKPVVSGQTALDPANDAFEADRASAASQRVPAFVEDGERR